MSAKRGNALVVVLAVFLVLSILVARYVHRLPAPQQNNINSPSNLAGKTLFCSNSDKIVALYDGTYSKLAIISLCQGKKIEAIDGTNNYFTVGRGGVIFPLRGSKDKVTVPKQYTSLENEQWEFERPSTSGSLKYYSFKTRSWKDFSFPALLNEKTQFELASFSPSVDSDDFVVTISKFDTNDARFYSRFAGSTPVSQRYLVLDTNTGVLAAYPYVEAANLAFKKGGLSFADRTNFGGCQFDALNSRKIYAHPCGEGVGVAGPLVEYNSLTGQTRKINGDEKNPANFVPQVPTDGSLIYYFSKSAGNRGSSSRDPQLWVPGEQTRLIILRKGTLETVSDGILKNVNIGISSQGIVNLIGQDNTRKLYLFDSRKVVNQSREKQLEVNLFVTSLSDTSNFRQISSVRDTRSCGDNALAYISENGREITLIFQNQTINFSLPSDWKIPPVVRDGDNNPYFSSIIASCY